MTAVIQVPYTLAKIEHYRCDEPADKWGVTTYVWIPQSMTKAEFDALAQQARESYLKAEREMKAASPAQPPGYGPSIHPNTPDTATVADLRADYEKREAAWKEYNEKSSAARKGFGKHLTEVSDGKIKLFWEVQPVLETKVSWGHNHGMTIDYEGTKLGDYPPVNEDEEDYV